MASLEIQVNCIFCKLVYIFQVSLVVYAGDVTRHVDESGDDHGFMLPRQRFVEEMTSLNFRN